jgi:hypothetical protein
MLPSCCFAVIPSGARNLPFGGLCYRRWGFFGADAPQNDRVFIHFANRASQHADKSYKSKRGARNRRNYNATTSDTHCSNDQWSRLATRQADYKGGSPCFLFGDFFKSEKATRCRTESCIPRPPAGRGRNPRVLPRPPAGRNPASKRRLFFGDFLCAQKATQ